MPTPRDAPYKTVQKLRPQKRRLKYDRVKAVDTVRLAQSIIADRRQSLGRRLAARLVLHAVVPTLTREERRHLGLIR